MQMQATAESADTTTPNHLQALIISLAGSAVLTSLVMANGAVESATTVAAYALDTFFGIVGNCVAFLVVAVIANRVYGLSSRSKSVIETTLQLAAALSKLAESAAVAQPHCHPTTTPTLHAGVKPCVVNVATTQTAESSSDSKVDAAISTVAPASDTVDDLTQQLVKTKSELELLRTNHAKLADRFADLDKERDRCFALYEKASDDRNEALDSLVKEKDKRRLVEMRIVDQEELERQIQSRDTDIERLSWRLETAVTFQGIYERKADREVVRGRQEREDLVAAHEAATKELHAQIARLEKSQGEHAQALEQMAEQRRAHESTERQLREQIDGQQAEIDIMLQRTLQVVGDLDDMEALHTRMTASLQHVLGQVEELEEQLAIKDMQLAAAYEGEWEEASEVVAASETNEPPPAITDATLEDASPSDAAPSDAGDEPDSFTQSDNGLEAEAPCVTAESDPSYMDVASSGSERDSRRASVESALSASNSIDAGDGRAEGVAVEDDVADEGDSLASAQEGDNAVDAPPPRTCSWEVDDDGVTIDMSAGPASKPPHDVVMSRRLMRLGRNLVREGHFDLAIVVATRAEDLNEGDISACCLVVRAILERIAHPGERSVSELRRYLGGAVYFACWSLHTGRHRFNTGARNKLEVAALVDLRRAVSILDSRQLRTWLAVLAYDAEVDTRAAPTPQALAASADGYDRGTLAFESNWRLDLLDDYLRENEQYDMDGLEDLAELFSSQGMSLSHEPTCRRIARTLMSCMKVTLAITAAERALTLDGQNAESLLLAAHGYCLLVQHDQGSVEANVSRCLALGQRGFEELAMRAQVYEREDVYGLRLLDELRFAMLCMAIRQTKVDDHTLISLHDDYFDSAPLREGA